MKSRHLLFILYGLLFAAFLSSAISFMTWNMPRAIKKDLTQGEGFIITHIDSCNFSDGRITASGFAYPESISQRYFGKTFVAIKSGGNLFKIRTERVDRQDIKNPENPGASVKSSGFIARSKYSFFSSDVSKEIYIITEYEGVNYVTKHKCN